MKNPDIFVHKRISMLDPELRHKSQLNYLLSQFKRSGTSPDGVEAWPDILERVPVERIRVFTGTTEGGTYNHQAGICKWRGRYYYVWGNSAIHEERPGMCTLLSTSDDLRAWSDPVCVAPGDPGADMWRQTAGIYSDDNRLVVFVQTKTGHKLSSEASMSANDAAVERGRIDRFVSTDGVHWQERPMCDDCWMFEPPKLTTEGRLLCGGSIGEDQPMVYLWPSDDPTQDPAIINLPYDPSRRLDTGMSPFGESSWYQTEQGDIFLFHRNETDGARLLVAVSRDGGLSWTEPMLSDIPDSMSRVSAGRLHDGRYYLVGNTIADLMNRIPLILTLSDDGYKFGSQYILIDEPTQIAFPGALKAHGHQYPATLPEEGRLLIAYSVNKEHMELIVVNTADL